MSSQTKRTALIIGAGPGGLTAALELLRKSDITPIVFEKSEYMGGISRTINYKGNRIDIGGHRFFSKSDRVMNWWLDIMPLEKTDSDTETIFYQGKSREIDSKSQLNPDTTDTVMLVRNRKSRIYFLRRFFDYPISLNLQTIQNLGLVRMIKSGFSYLKARVLPIKNEKSLEDFFINRFGKELYLTFFKSYTEKVWGIACEKISAEWGAQRIKGLSISKAIGHYFGKIFKANTNSISQKSTETSLIEKFLYPKYGPGQMWEEVAKQVQEKGGIIHTHSQVSKILTKEKKVIGIEVKNIQTGEVTTYMGDYVFSTMPIKELIADLDCPVPSEVVEVSQGLLYRDFITVGLLVKDLKIKDETAEGKKLVTDNWIYIQEPDVKVGRLQIFNNWSPYMVNDPSNVWIGMEYFCNEGDELWNKETQEMIEFGKMELDKIGIIDKSLVIDATVIKMEKTYPAYFGTYDRFDVIKDYINQFTNLFLIGRNGMHRYNNQDHSMLTAMMAVDNIIAGIEDKSNLWAVNTEQEYHEKR